MMRAISLLVLTALFPAGGVPAAFAVTVPLLADPRGETTSSSREPTRSPSSTTAHPAPREATTPAAAPMSGATQRGNPLWAVPLRYLPATRQRPLFAPSRRPPPPVVISMPQVAAPPPPPPRKPPEPEKPQLSLVGTIAGGGEAGLGVFIEPATRTIVRLKTGENYKGWILRAVQRGEVVLQKGGETATLSLPSPELKQGPLLPAVGSRGTRGNAAAAPTEGPSRAPMPNLTFGRPDIKPTPAAVNPFQASWERQLRTPLQPGAPISPATR